MNWIVVLAGIWIGVIWSFVAVMHAKVIYEHGGLSTFWLIHIVPLALVGLVLDLAFNLTFGTLMFLEPPRELLFSTRVQRHVRKSDGWRSNLAYFWGRQLNAIDRGHIRE